MRIPSLVLAACAALLMTTGCMTDDSMARGAYAKRSTFEDNIDYRKINRVEAQAAQSGHLVVWVNRPTKKIRFSRTEQVGID